MKMRLFTLQELPPEVKAVSGAYTDGFQSIDTKTSFFSLWRYVGLK